MADSKEEISNFTINSSSESSSEVSKTSAQKDGKEDNNKDGKQGKFGGVFDHINNETEKNNANPENDRIVSVLIGIKSSALKNAAKGNKESTIKIPAEKITTYASGREEKETIEIDMSPEQAQELIGDAEQNKSKEQGVKGLLKDVIKGLAGKITPDENKENNGPGHSVESIEKPKSQEQTI